MKLTKLTILPLALGFLALANVSCEKQTPAEEISEEVKEANEEIGDAVEDATE